MNYDRKNPKAILADALPDSAKDIISLARRIEELEKEQAAPSGNDCQNDSIPDFVVSLNLGRKGDPLRTVENFLRIMRADPYYEFVRYNLLSWRRKPSGTGKRSPGPTRTTRPAFITLKTNMACSTGSNTTPHSACF